MADQRQEVRQLLRGPRERVLYTSTEKGYPGFRECFRWARARGLLAAHYVITDADDDKNGRVEVIREDTRG